jgi:PAS domain-containing protein
MIDKTYHPFSGSKRDEPGDPTEELKQRIEILQARLTLLGSENERLKKSREQADGFGGSPEKKQVESNLMYREEVLQSVFSESAEAFLLTTSPERRIVQCNRIAVEMFEVESQERLISRSAYALHRVLNPDEIGMMGQQLLKTGCWSAEILCLTTRGRTFWGNIMVKSMYASGTGYELVRVRTVKEKSAERVNGYSARLEAVLESTRDVVFSLDTHFRYTSFNTNHQRLMRNNYGIEIALEKKAFNREKDFCKDYKRIANELRRAMKGEQLTVRYITSCI